VLWVGQLSVTSFDLCGVVGVGIGNLKFDGTERVMDLLVYGKSLGIVNGWNGLDRVVHMANLIPSERFLVFVC